MSFRKLSQLATAFVLAIALSACGGGAEAPQSAADIKARIAELKTELAGLEEQLAALDTGRAERSSLVRLQALQPSTFRHFIEIQGMVESDRVAMVSPSMAGTLKRILVREGQRVGAGATIATIDDAVLRQSLAEAQTQLELLKTVFERQERLWEQRIGTEIQYIQAKNNYEAMQARLATVKEQLKLYVVSAPFAGTVDEVFPVEGELASPGMPIVRLMGGGRHNVRVNLSEQYVGRVRPGDTVQLEFPDLRRAATGRVATVSGTINPATRTFVVEVEPAGNTADLRNNLVVFVRFNDYTARNAMVVPLSVVRSSDDERFVYIAEQRDGRHHAKRINVTLGKVYADRAEIKQGLQPGMMLIATGFQDVTDGQPLRIETEAAEAPEAPSAPTASNR